MTGLHSSPHRAGGLSLIEVLIALVVLSIGLTGMAALHLNSLQSVHSAHYRSMASAISLDFEERLWLEVSTASDADLVDGCPNTSHVADELLEYWSNPQSGWDWSDAEKLQLPNLQVSVGDAVAGEAWTEIPITLAWAENRFRDQEMESFDYTVRVVCRPA